jgi:hypothetical protein|tara:strand:+ start:1457 stop:2050 length:594 start_codon:yes stop_codon:yes gene_type:complete
MREQFVKDKYLYLPNFISYNRAGLLAEELISDANKYDWESDWDVAPNCAAQYNPIGAAELLCEQIGKVGELVGEPVFPTYSFGRVYRRGDTLPKHTDRAACEISMTVHLYGDEEWYFGCYDKKFSLNPGDAILYLGTIVPHYRVGAYEGDEYAQFFLHYVRTRGCHNNCIFDSADSGLNNQQLIKELNTWHMMNDIL